MEREMNFWDLCVACARALGKACVGIWHVIARMIRLTCKYWYIVVPIVVLAIAAAIYHTRKDNIKYRVNAIAYVNGASLQQFEKAFEPLQSGQLLPDDAKIKPFMWHKQAGYFNLFRVVDVHHDGIADYVDFKRKSSPNDTLEVQMHDRVCIQFRTPAYAIPLIPEIETAILEVLNGNEALQQAHTVYVENLKEEVAFNHRQRIKLDSLTSVYYYNAGSPAAMINNEGSGVNFYGDRKIRLFLNEIYKQHVHTQNGDLRLQLATAPVVLENHFSVDPNPVMTRMKCVILFFLLGWCAGCLIAEIIDRRRKIAEWLKA